MSEQVYISEAHLKGYKSILDAQMTFKPGLNIIIGKNGSGKTNLIQYINQLLRFRLDDFIEIDSYIKLEDNKETYLIDYKKIITFTEKQIQLSQEIKINNKVIGNDEEKDFLDSGLSFQMSLVNYQLPNDALIISKPFQVEDIFAIGEQSKNILSTIRKNPDILFSNTLLASLFFAEMDYKPAYKENIKNRINQFLLSLEESVKKYTIINSIRLSPEFDVVFNDEKFEIKNLVFEYFANDIWNKFEQLSDGTQRIVYTIAETQKQAYYHWGKSFIGYSTSPYSKISFIEEPELGIHPHQLHQLMNFIKEESEDKQIILTTHSPQVLNVLSAEELDRILICEWTPEKGTQLRHMTEKESEDAKIYMHEVGYLSDYWLHSGFNTL